MDELKVSVIIPVYNAEKFLRNAVESAVHLDEVGEVLLIDDGFPDNALRLASELIEEYRKVKLFRHPGGENRGAAESRNLGIRHAKYHYISFLDADDFYLPNRFKMAKLILGKDNTIDGVYDAVGTKYYDKASLNVELRNGLTTIPTRPSGKALFEILINPGHGHFHTNGIVVKKSLIEKAGYFNPVLRLHQDTDLWVKLSYLGNIVPGETDCAVAMRGVHVQNRIASRSFESKGKLYKSLFEFFLDKNISRKSTYFIFRNYILFNKKRFNNSVMNALSNVGFALKTVIRHPGYLVKLSIG